MRHWISAAKAAKAQRQILTGPFKPTGGYGWTMRLPGTGGDDDTNLYKSNFCLYEDDQRLTAAHQPSIAINTGGKGRYVHWEDAIFFSTSDGSDPNTNGRRYSFDYSLTMSEWERDRLERGARRWLQHSRGAEILQRPGANVTPPPLAANFGLTNKCNLRCEICGSQKHLDNTGVRRRHMDYATFEVAAETLFPLLSVVELNSQGDPLLYPHIQDVLRTIQRHRCEVKIQHNGTLLTNSTIDLILQQYGTLMLSLDAVGEKFDAVRRGGIWAKAQIGLERLLAERTPSRLSVGVYPTLTKRTIGEALTVANWCAERSIESIGFHRYVPVQGSWEEAPSETEYAALCDELRAWCRENNDVVQIMFEGERLNCTTPRDLRTEYPDATKKVALVESGKFMFPLEASSRGADYFTSCSSPSEYVEIGLEGQISACCRSQDVTLGHVSSLESFADAWLGLNYTRIRRSLLRGAKGDYPLPNCASCVEFFAPSEAKARAAVDYARPAAEGEERLDLAQGRHVEIEVIQKEEGHCHVAVFPVGLGHPNFELWEDDRRLGPKGAPHDEIRDEGQGSYQLGQTELYFSTSDGTDARRNGRRYSLRQIAPPDLADLTKIALDVIAKDKGHCVTAALAVPLRHRFYDVWEDETRLGPKVALHDEIREEGFGAFHLTQERVLFSSSDGTDPRRNGRVYTLREGHKPNLNDSKAVEIEIIQREQGFCYVFELETPLDCARYELWEDNRRLGPADAMHDDIRTHGMGRYHLGIAALYFSSSDGADPRRNGRSYVLRLIESV